MIVLRENMSYHFIGSVPLCEFVFASSGNEKENVKGDFRKLRGRRTRDASKWPIHARWPAKGAESISEAVPPLSRL